MFMKKLFQHIRCYRMRLKRKEQENQRLKDKNTRLAKLLDIKRGIK